ncbi:pre-tape measure frameshift protein G [Xylella phage Sano]|uniref:Pre-tape measure frameshift protein G n=1 Tax=Xylella phage Sano TaxID=1415148 RepID=V5Q9H5_9CAUD|nr:tail length tape measure protein [Xylella phage Sano]AHB12075.1 pre-tape measure frameshift protein G [Xylella phage Sano]
MSLSSLRLRTITVPYLGADDEQQSIVLFGLNANDVAGIIIAQKDNMEEIFDIVEGAGVKKATDLAEVDMMQIGQKLMVQMPDFIARVIAYAAHEPEAWMVAMQLDAPTQIKCMRAIAELTFKDEAGFREFLGNVQAALRGAKSVVPHLRNKNLESSDSQGGGSESEQQSPS